jgi:hypothetical protein
MKYSMYFNTNKAPVFAPTRSVKIPKPVENEPSPQQAAGYQVATLQGAGNSELKAMISSKMMMISQVDRFSDILSMYRNLADT